ncbi:DUF7848 domain-containing protein [Streptomyces sp. URMC 123]|uniref:DUF7848 domain-containing protein n=1 Tax=Streptomyces sp. URMC 123 TaxID=3423403 RepID=UPI003F1DCFC9
MARAVYRFVDWKLEGLPTKETPSHITMCVACGVRSTPFLDVEQAELWALKHAGLSRHTAYEHTVTYYWRASMVDGS